jgi:hypothetical protein
MEKPIAAMRRRIKIHTRDSGDRSSGTDDPTGAIPSGRPPPSGFYFSSQRSRKRGMRSGIHSQFWTLRFITANSAV